ncbi:MAG: hypothetical protein ACREMY_27905, partial [bacterium]
MTAAHEIAYVDPTSAEAGPLICGAFGVSQGGGGGITEIKADPDPLPLDGGSVPVMVVFLTANPCTL